MSFCLTVLMLINMNNITKATVPVEIIAESATSAVIWARMSERPDNFTMNSPSLSCASSSKSEDNALSKSAVACQSKVAAWNDIRV